MHDKRQNRSPHEIVNNISRIYGAAAGAVKWKLHVAQLGLQSSKELTVFNVRIDAHPVPLAKSNKSKWSIKKFIGWMNLWIHILLFSKSKF